MANLDRRARSGRSDSEFISLLKIGLYSRPKFFIFGQGLEIRPSSYSDMEPAQSTSSRAKVAGISLMDLLYKDQLSYNMVITSPNRSHLPR